jgi:hypothetical protein
MSFGEKKYGSKKLMKEVKWQVESALIVTAEEFGKMV